MKKIGYHYTNLAKQILIIVCFLYTFLRFLIMLEIMVFKIDGYYDNLNIPLTLLLYAVLFLLLLILFRGHKICISAYDENTLTYYNTLLRKSKSLDLSTVKLAVLIPSASSFMTIQTRTTRVKSQCFSSRSSAMVLSRHWTSTLSLK